MRKLFIVLALTFALLLGTTSAFAENVVVIYSGTTKTTLSAKEEQYMILTYSAKLRTDATSSSSSNGSVYRYDRVSVSKTKNGYSYVTTAGGRSGYVLSDYVTPIGSLTFLEETPIWMCPNSEQANGFIMYAEELQEAILIAQSKDYWVVIFSNEDDNCVGSGFVRKDAYVTACAPNTLLSWDYSAEFIPCSGKITFVEKTNIFIAPGVSGSGSVHAMRVKEDAIIFGEYGDYWVVSFIQDNDGDGPFSQGVGFVRK